jgi:GT2 family glycosyltransferase
MCSKERKKHINMITASIVLFNQDLKTLKKTVTSFLQTPINKKLFLIDNSSENKLQEFFNQPEIEYIFIGKNIGFGAAHNMILNKISSKYHLILNPDVVFNVDVIPTLIKVLETNINLAFTTPKVIYPNNDLQYVCRKHPSFFDLINKRLHIFKTQIFKNEYRDKNLEKPFYPDFIHGCFMLFRTKDLQSLNGFDERYFLYMEDADICRKIDKLGKKKLYFPDVEIIHHHQKGSSKHLKLFLYHITSAIKYFLKWGFR